MQTRRIEKLEQYIESLGGDPVNVIESATSGSTSLQEPVVSIDMSVDCLKLGDNTGRLRDGASGIANEGSQCSEQARLVEHDEETTYVEVFAHPFVTHFEES